MPSHLEPSVGKAKAKLDISLMLGDVSFVFGCSLQSPDDLLCPFQTPHNAPDNVHLRPTEKIPFQDIPAQASS